MVVLPSTVSAVTVNKVCGSGLKAVMMAAQGVQLGDSEIVVAGGMESMSNAPYLLPKAREGYRLGNGELVDSMIKTDCGVRLRITTWAALVKSWRKSIQSAAASRMSLRSTRIAKLRRRLGRSLKTRSCRLRFRRRRAALVFDTDETVREDTTTEVL